MGTQISQCLGLRKYAAVDAGSGTDDDADDEEMMMAAVALELNALDYKNANTMFDPHIEV